MTHSFFLYMQFNWPTTGSLGQFFYIVLLVAFVALLAYYSTKLLATARMGRTGRLPGAYKRNLEVIEHVSVGTQAMAQIIRAGEQYFLIGVTKEQVTLLAALEADTLAIAADKPGVSLSFDKVLRRFMKRDETAPNSTTAPPTMSADESTSNEARDDE